MIVLNYHRVDENGGPDIYTICPPRLARRLKMVRELGLRVVGIDEALAARVDEGFVMFHFDDGTEDHAQHVMPLLAEAGVRGAFFISTGKIGRAGYLTVAQVKELAAAGHDIECHGHSHRRMDRLAADELEGELATSVALIREWTGRAPRVLATPGGFINRRIIETARRHGLGTVRTMSWNVSSIPVGGLLDCLVVTRAVSEAKVNGWLQGRGLHGLRMAYFINQTLRCVLPFSLYLKLRNGLLTRSPEPHVVTDTPTRNGFLAGCLAELRAAEVPFCISRNHGEFWQDGPSDVDLMVSPSRIAAAEHCIALAARANGLRLVLRTWFGNLCLVYHAPTAGFVRVDLDGAVHWRSYTLLAADALLAERIEEDGLPIPCPEHAVLVLLCQCAWVGKAKPAYRERLRQLTSDAAVAARVHEFIEGRFGFGRQALLKLIEDGDAAELQRCFRRAPIQSQRIHNACLLVVRAIKRLLRPPGIVIDCRGAAEVELSATATRLELLFPSAKAARGDAPLLRVVAAMFRGGIVWNDSARPRIVMLIVRLWGGRARSFRWSNGEIRYQATGRAAATATTPDFIGSMLADSIAR